LSPSIKHSNLNASLDNVTCIAWYTPHFCRFILLQKISNASRKKTILSIFIIQQRHLTHNILHRQSNLPYRDIKRSADKNDNTSDDYFGVCLIAGERVSFAKIDPSASARHEELCRFFKEKSADCKNKMRDDSDARASLASYESRASIYSGE